MREEVVQVSLEVNRRAYCVHLSLDPCNFAESQLMDLFG